MVVIAAALSELHNRIRVDFCFNWNLDKRGFLIKEGARGEFGFSLKAHFLYGRYLCFKRLPKLWNYRDFCIDYSNVWPDVYVSPVIDSHNLA